MNDRIKFAVNENTIMQCDLTDFLEACKKAGFRAVEISYAKLTEALRFLSKDELRKAYKGLEILSLNAFEDIYLVPNSNLKVLEAETTLLGELCSQIGCPAVVAPSGRWYAKYGELPEEDEIISLYRSRLGLVKEVLDSFNVETMFEPIAYPEFIVGTPKDINKVLSGDVFNDVLFVPDIHNLYFNGLGAIQLDDINAKIGLFHIDDTPKLPREKLHVAETRAFPGEGIADASKWINLAKKNGYEGYYSLELFDKQIYEMNPKDAAQLCRVKLEVFAESC